MMNETPMLAGKLAIFRINYKSDFILTLESDAGWETPFCIKFWTGAPSQAYYAGWDGTTYTNCAPVEGDPSKLQVQFDNHHLPIGELKYQVGYHFTVADFPTTVEDEVINQDTVVIVNNGRDEKVLLDFNGETAPDIQFALPAYVNEAQRIANEQQRIANEQTRIANEQQRIQNEEQRIAQETARVEEFASLKRETESAAQSANDAATLANAEAQLAAEKAALAQAAATLANDKAALAQQKAEYAQTQGDYAKAQGDTAAADHQTAVADHQTAAADHQTAVADHTQAGNDHTRAESDHTRAESDHAAVELFVDSLGAFDISAYHATGGVLAKYANLTAALDSNNGGGVPQSLQKGGMSVKFVCSSDNKYIQYLLTKDEWSASEGDWEKMNLEEEVSQLDHYLLTNYLTGYGNNIVSNKIFGLLPNTKYRISFVNPEWSMSGVTITGVYRFVLQKSLNGTDSVIGGVYIGNTMPSYYEFTTDSSFDYYNINIRAAVGEIVQYNVEQSGIISAGLGSYRGDAEIYLASGGVLDIKVDGQDVYFKYSQSLAGRRSLNFTWSLQELVTNLSLTTSGGYAKLESAYSIVIDANTKLPAIKARSNVKEEDIPILSNAGGIITDIYPSLIYNVYYNNFGLGAYKGNSQVYIASGGVIEIKVDGSDLYFKYSQSLVGRVGLNFSWSFSDLVTNLSLTTSGGYAKLESTDILVVDASTHIPALKDRTNVNKNDLILLANAGGYIGYIHPTIAYNILDKKIEDVKSTIPLIVPTMQDKGNSFAQLFQSASGQVEPFLFFSDPHWFSDYSNAGMNSNGEQGLSLIKELFETTPTNFVLCGGDWLTSHKQSVAIKDLAYVDGLMNKMFPDMYYPIFGNHDNNYQGEQDTTETDANDGTLTDQQMINLWFRKWGKMYYEFSGTCSKFYVLNTGSDWDNNMTYGDRWTQVDWFANKLLNGNDEHIIIALHIVHRLATPEFDSINVLADNITKIAEAFNSRTSITLNNVTYDFSSCVGKVHCLLCGHTHYDTEKVINSIPVFVIKNTGSGDFDLVLIDYAANKLKSVRVGSGSDREMAIVS